MTTRRTFLTCLAAFLVAGKAVPMMDRAEQLVLYVCNAFRNDPTFDERKLMSVIFRIDMESFLQTGKSISGKNYVKTATGVEWA